MEVRTVEASDLEEWLRMRLALWPGQAQEEHRAEMSQLLTDPRSGVFVFTRPKAGLCGFIEAGLRDYAEGCASSPVGYIEGWYIDQDWRREHLGSYLVEAVEAWAREAGCTEIASDCLYDNRISFRAHLALGYEEVERLIYFRKDL